MSVDKLKAEISTLKSFIERYPREKRGAFRLLEENLERKKRFLLDLEDARSPLAKKLNL